MYSKANHIIIWILIVVLVLLVLGVLFDVIMKKNRSLENFTPRLGQFYRPFSRRIRIFGEGFYSTFSTFRKSGAKLFRDI